MSKPSFATMWNDELQTYSVAEVKSTLGGSINSPAIDNCCCVRVSHALIKAGHPITIASDYKDKFGNKYIIKVKTMTTYLRDKYGSPRDVTDPANASGR
jgi:hypothetical protein